MSVDTTASAAGDSPAGSPAGADTEGVVAMFRRVLETEDVSADSDFFLLGGDSLVATRVLSAIARSYGVELTFEDFLGAPTPEQLAEKITDAR
ncbi:acyl carrier protein [Streptomyces sp. TLI_105]|uniref:acyl carrier protein n=1 Tax=Streptomyces sp. TLI_105 TaxID=1881019 RepID=UPI00089D3106|nr:acyl carrier protein [Streptomyces sp. TLI_105]SEE07275.1 Phosphopantetheine attachment site [Streptomyces sp. TLI_105]